VAVLERVGQVVFSRFEVVVEHVLASHVKFVRHLLRFWISEKLNIFLNRKFQINLIMVNR